MANYDRGPEMLYVAIIFTAISIFSLGLRCYTMGHILNRFFPADWVAVLTGVSDVFFALKKTRLISSSLTNAPSALSPCWAYSTAWENTWMT